MVFPGFLLLTDLEEADGNIVVPEKLALRHLAITVHAWCMHYVFLAWIPVGWQSVCHHVSLQSEPLPDTSWAVQPGLWGLGRGKIHCVHSKGF
jgi:hypothetical protein